MVEYQREDNVHLVYEKRSHLFTLINWSLWNDMFSRNILFYCWNILQIVFYKEYPIFDLRNT